MSSGASARLTEHPVSVLLVDDQPMVGEAVRRMLEKESDLQFHYCADPTTAQRAWRYAQPCFCARCAARTPNG